MIRIHKPAEGPQVLRTKGAQARRTLSAAYTRDPQSYDSGTKTFEFDSGLYGHASVKSALLEAQYGKCAFCESKFTHIAYGDVEHFRPKGGCHQAEGEPLLRPGYYWLAYEWTNLFLSCTLCNQRFKRNLFPLKTPARRARNHPGDVRSEDPLLLDPAVDEPEALIGYRQEVPYAIDGNARGQTTIDVFKLHRPELAEQRRDHLEKVKALRIIAESDRLEAPWAQDVLGRMRQDDGQYASMTRAALR